MQTKTENILAVVILLVLIFGAIGVGFLIVSKNKTSSYPEVEPVQNVAQTMQKEQKQPVLGAVTLTEVSIPDNPLFNESYEDLFVAIDVLNQLSKQGIPIVIKQGDDDFASKAIKEANTKLKKHGITSYTVKVKRKNGTIKKTKVKSVSVKKSPIVKD